MASARRRAGGVRKRQADATPSGHSARQSGRSARRRTSCGRKRRADARPSGHSVMRPRRGEMPKSKSPVLERRLPDSKGVKATDLVACPDPTVPLTACTFRQRSLTPSQFHTPSTAPTGRLSGPVHQRGRNQLRTGGHAPCSSKAKPRRSVPPTELSATVSRGPSSSTMDVARLSFPASCPPPSSRQARCLHGRPRGRRSGRGAGPSQCAGRRPAAAGNRTPGTCDCRQSESGLVGGLDRPDRRR